MEPKDEKIKEETPIQESEETQAAAQESIEETGASKSHDDEHREKKKKHGKESADEKLQQLGEKLAEKEDQYKRLYADFENHRKRTNIEKAELILNGGKDVIKSLLPIIDDLERALQSMSEDDAAAEGVRLIYAKLMKTLEAKGLKPMDAKGEKFNEDLHEAVTRIPAAGEEQKGIVVDVVEKGYYLNEKVLRYAKVVVAF
ncbi:MAG: nucleotide exchange factor GrpE [Bacteroidales bacterium]|nr:nucleotide exchange factor GrpE [Bacteroidales bacterium]